jgi:hypothetical protein
MRTIAASSHLVLSLSGTLHASCLQGAFELPGLLPKRRSQRDVQPGHGWHPQRSISPAPRALLPPVAPPPSTSILTQPQDDTISHAANWDETSSRIPTDQAFLAGRAADPEAEITKHVRTGDQVVEFYAQYGQDSPVTFFFCKRVDAGLDWRPYDLEVVKREAAGDDCYTISASGVMHMRKGVRAGVCEQ